MDSKNFFSIIGVLAVFSLAYLYFWGGMPSSNPTNTTNMGASAIGQTEKKNSEPAAKTILPVEKSANIGKIEPQKNTSMVTYTSSGFLPGTVTIKVGETVQFVNKSSGTEMWVASDSHPSHTVYSGTTKDSHCPDTAGTAFDQCTPGNTYSFTFQKIGTWGYHNHFLSDDKGTIIVTK